MALLVSVSDVIESMGMNAELESDLDPAISRAIPVAQTRLETELDTRLDRLLTKDTFNADSDLFSGVTPHGLLVLRLKNGFVAEVVSFKACQTFNGEFADIPVADYRLDKDKGLLFLSPVWDAYFVEIEYRSGFLGAGSTPAAVKRAILHFVPTALKIAQPVDAEKKKTADDVGNLATGIINGLRRGSGVHFRPVYSESAASLT